MSEFSESHHLRTDDQAEAVELLERARRSGWVFPPANGWTMIVVDAPFDGEPDPTLVAANEGLLLHYVNAEDHGWGFSVFDGTDAVSTYEIEWTDEVDVDDEELDLDALRARLPHVADEQWQAIERELGEPDEDALVALVNPGHRVAAALGLAQVEWVSGPYLASDPPDTPGVVRFDAPGPPRLRSV